MDPKQISGLPWSETATHATSAVATHAAVAGKTYYITDYSGSSDKSGALLLIKDGTTTIWQEIIGTTPHSHNFKVPLVITAGAACSITVDGTSLCKSNISGYAI